MQIKGNAEEFVMYGVLHAAAVSPRQLAIDMRDVPKDLWQHPFLQHTLQVCPLRFQFIVRSHIRVDQVVVQLQENQGRPDVAGHDKWEACVDVFYFQSQKDPTGSN